MTPSGRQSGTTSLSDRCTFVKLWAEGMSARAIARTTGSSVTTVCKWITRWKKEGHVNLKPSKGRRQIFPNDVQRLLYSHYEFGIKTLLQNVHSDFGNYREVHDRGYPISMSNTVHSNIRNCFHLFLLLDHFFSPLDFSIPMDWLARFWLSSSYIFCHVWRPCKAEGREFTKLSYAVVVYCG